MITTNVSNLSLNIVDEKIHEANVFVNANIGYISLSGNVLLNNENGYDLNDLTPKEWFEKAKEEFIKELAGGIN